MAPVMKVGDHMTLLIGKMVIRQSGVPLGVEVVNNLNLTSMHRFVFFTHRGVALRS